MAGQSTALSRLPAASGRRRRDDRLAFSVAAVVSSPSSAELLVCALSRAVRVFRASSSWLVCFLLKHNNQLELKARSGAGLPVRGVAERGFRAFFKA